MIFIRTFGGLSVTAEGSADVILVHQPRRLALLALLAAAGPDGLSRDRALLLLTPEHDEASARNSLNKALFGLRRSLGHDAILSEGSAIRLNPREVGSDWSAFQEAMSGGRPDAAAALIAGRFLEGFHLPHSAEFEEWADAERRRLDGQFELALEQAAESAHSRGDLREAVARWAALAARNPTSDRIAAAYMRVLRDRGDAAAALRFARDHMDRLQREFGTGPGPLVLAAIAQVRHEESGAPDQTEARAPNVTPVTRQTPPVLAPPRRPGVPVPEVVVTTGARRPGPGRRRAPVVMAALVLAMAAAVAAWRSRTPPRDPGLVSVLAFRTDGGDTALARIGTLLGREAAAGLAATGLVRVAQDGDRDASTAWSRLRLGIAALVRGRSPTAAYVVSGLVRREGDSVIVHAEVASGAADRTVRSAAAIGGRPDSLPRLMEGVRQSVSAAIGMALDPRTAGWSAAAVAPSRFAAYQLFGEALGLHWSAEQPQMQSRLLAAAAADSGFFLPVLWRLFGPLPESVRDSLMRHLEVRRNRLGSLERAMLDYQSVAFGDNAFRRYAAAERMARLAPGCDWILWVLANDAGKAARPADAFQALARIDTAGPWMSTIGEAAYWTFRQHTAHATGQFEIAAHAARRAAALRPDGRWLRALEIPELAALGRVPELLEVLEQGVAEREQPPALVSWLHRYVQAASELFSHGHAALVPRVVASFDSTLAALEAGGQDGNAFVPLREQMSRWRMGTGVSVHRESPDPGGTRRTDPPRSQ